MLKYHLPDEVNPQIPAPPSQQGSLISDYLWLDIGTRHITGLSTPNLNNKNTHITKLKNQLYEQKTGLPQRG